MLKNNFNLYGFLPFWSAFRQVRMNLLPYWGGVLLCVIHALLLLNVIVHFSQDALAQLLFICVLVGLAADFLDEIARRGVKSKRCFFAVLGMMFSLIFLIRWLLLGGWVFLVLFILVLMFFLMRILRILKGLG